MSDTDSTSSGDGNVGADDNDGHASIASDVRELCNRLRAQRITLRYHFSAFEIKSHRSQAEAIEIVKALEENTSVNRVRFHLGEFAKITIIAIAKYVEFSKTLQTLDLTLNPYHCCQGMSEMIAVLFRALSRNTSVTQLTIDTDIITFASVAFQELLTCTQTLQRMRVFASPWHTEFDEVPLAAITSGFADNTTLRDLRFDNWREDDLTPVLTALQHHPALEKIQFSVTYYTYIPSLSGLEVLLRSQNSKVKELVFDQVHTSTVGVYPVMQAMVRNTTVTNLAIRDSLLNDELAQQLKAVLRRNTTLQHLILRHNRLGNKDMAEIASVLYRNTSIKTLDYSYNNLNDVESSNVLRELIRRNKKITNLRLFGALGNVATFWSIADSVRSNTTIQQLDLGGCRLDDQAISLLANALATRNASILELDLIMNKITSAGVRALVGDNVEAVKTLTKFSLTDNPLRSEGARILADALGHNAMPSLERLHLGGCRIEDDGFVALVSALEHNTSLQILDAHRNSFGERGRIALAQSLPNIKGLQQINLVANGSSESTLPLLLEGLRKNTSLVKVDIDRCEPGEWSHELKFLGHRNRFTSLLKSSDSQGASPRLGIWSGALAKIATEPDVLFYVLRKKPELVGYAGDSKKRKRKRNEE